MWFTARRAPFRFHRAGGKPLPRNRSRTLSDSGAKLRAVICWQRSARKSHSKTQRRPVSGDTQLRQATVEAGQVPSEPSPATSSDAREVTGGQGVAGSNPAAPTGS